MHSLSVSGIEWGIFGLAHVLVSSFLSSSSFLQLPGLFLPLFFGALLDLVSHCPLSSILPVSLSFFLSLTFLFLFSTLSTPLPTLRLALSAACFPAFVAPFNAFPPALAAVPRIFPPGIADRARSNVDDCKRSIPFSFALSQSPVTTAPPSSTTFFTSFTTGMSRKASLAPLKSPCTAFPIVFPTPLAVSTTVLTVSFTVSTINSPAFLKAFPIASKRPLFLRKMETAVVFVACEVKDV
uniref:Transmembrane protein n=1 Tax=Cacopsylla melanoneura TaxID=428564 RepID=A0A8D8M4P5_9HEMI